MVTKAHIETRSSPPSHRVLVVGHPHVAWRLQELGMFVEHVATAEEWTARTSRANAGTFDAAFVSDSPWCGTSGEMLGVELRNRGLGVVFVARFGSQNVLETHCGLLEDIDGTVEPMMVTIALEVAVRETQKDRSAFDDAPPSMPRPRVSRTKRAMGVMWAMLVYAALMLV